MRWLYPSDLGLLSESFQVSDEVVMPLKRWNSNQLSTNEVVVHLNPWCSKQLPTDEVVVFLILCNMSY